MAEAHQAVRYSKSFIYEQPGHDQEVMQIVFNPGWQSWVKRSAKLHNSVRNFIYPGKLSGVWIYTGAVAAAHAKGFKLPMDLISNIVKYLPGKTYFWQGVACTMVGTTCWFTSCMFFKNILRLLLRYQGYMHETRGKKISFKTKIWALLLKAFVKWNPPNLYSFQDILPILPVPSVKDTLRRYLRSVRPLLDDANFERVSREALEFEKEIASKLQRYLIFKSWVAPNYVSDWWEEYVYLRSDTPIMVNSNIYCADNQQSKTSDQAARAANSVYLFLKFREEVESQKLPPWMVQNMVPLCSNQYIRLFNTTRIPGVNGDKIVHIADSNHIAVLYKGCWFRLPIYYNGRLLNPPELKYQLDYILNSEPKTSHAEFYLAALTSWNRKKWAETRDTYFADGINKRSLECIESAAFVLILHDEPFEGLKPRDDTKLHNYAKQCMHGKVYDFWFDKSFNISVGTNGVIAFNAEHSWADAPVISRMLEESMLEDLFCYDEEGNLLGEVEMIPPLPHRLQWNLTDKELINRIDTAYADGLKLINDVDHQIVIHYPYGKGFIKTCRLSPDAYIQMALQLAYFRDLGKSPLTYEASMTRLYKHGRTETVRSCTIESSAWVRAMEDENSTVEERVRLLREACTRHQQLYLEAMTGKGIDRHLFCLYVVSKYLEIESPFLNEVINEPWRLSTSQTPHGQTDKIDLKKYPELKGIAGGFGPVSSDGYSVSYIVSGEDDISFHLSSCKSCPLTSTDRFGKRIIKALADMKETVEEFNKQQKK